LVRRGWCWGVCFSAARARPAAPADHSHHWWLLATTSPLPNPAGLATQGVCAQFLCLVPTRARPCRAPCPGFFCLADPPCRPAPPTPSPAAIPWGAVGGVAVSWVAYPGACTLACACARGCVRLCVPTSGTAPISAPWPRLTLLASWATFASPTALTPEFKHDILPFIFPNPEPPAVETAEE
jgi:hypothetical protein